MPKKPKAKPTSKPKDIRTASQYGADNLAALRKVFAAFRSEDGVSEKQESEAGKVFRDVNNRFNELEGGK